MTMLGAESFNGPLNQADLNAKGYWAGANAITGAGVAYGIPLQYRSLMRVGALAVSTFPFSAASGFDSQPGVINLGLAQDMYAAGGFYIGVTANFIDVNPTWVGSNGTKAVGIGSSLLAGFNLNTDLVNWGNVVNTSSGFSGTTSKTSISYANGAYYFAGQSADLSFFWSTSTDIPGNFVNTQMQASSNAFMNNLIDFAVMSVGGTAYYAGGYISSPSVMSRIVRSTTGATNSWSAVYTGTGAGQIWKLYEFSGALYACEYSTVGGNSKGQVLRSTDGTTWNVVHTSTPNGSSLCQRMAFNGVQTLVVVGAGGYLASSTDNGLTWVQRTTGTTDNILDITWTGSEFAAMTSTHATLVSTDGLTWTYTSRPLMAGITGQQTYILRVGSEILAYSVGVAANCGYRWNSTTKLWDIIKATNATYTSNATSTPPTGVYFGTLTGGTSATISGGRSLMGFSLLTDGLWSVGVEGAVNWGTKLYQFNTTPVANINSPKRLELDYVAVAGQSIPTFDVYWYVDGVRAPNPLRVTATAGQNVLFTTAGLGHNQWYDFVYGNKLGVRNNNPLGNVRLLKKQNAVDTQAQWDKVPSSVATNAAAAQGNGSWTQSPSSVQSTTPGQIDQYSGGMPALPSGYRIAAVKLEAVGQRVGLTNPTVRMGLVDGGAALTPAAAVLVGSAITPLRTLYETNNAGQGWSFAGARDALVSVENQAFGPTDDQYWAAVAMLAKFNGTAGSTTLVDSSGKTALRCINNASQSAGQAKYYPTSLDLTAASTGVQFTLNTNLIWGTGDYTIETWLYPTSSAAVGTIFFPSEVSSGNFFYLARLTDGTIRMLGYRNSSLSTLGTTTNAAAQGSWSHVAATRQSGTVRLFINGVLGATFNDTFNYALLPAATGYIGVQTPTGGNPMTGYMSEFRITMGIARYTSAFTPPTAALPDH